MKYRVLVSYSFDIEAENEDEAESKAFDEMSAPDSAPRPKDFGYEVEEV